jgi:hypothetical protein
MLASECKCCECGQQAVAFWPVIDPDIPSHPYCRKCEEIKYTIYGEKGVTPFCIGCKCGSSMQHKDTLPMWMSEVLVKAEKWVRPTYEQFTKLSIGMQEHIVNYGLILESELK